MSDELLRALVDLRDRQIQKARIQFGNRLSALERQADNGQGQQIEIVQKWAVRFETLEKEIDADIADTVADYPIYEHMSAVKGVGPSLSAQIIAMVDIHRAPTVSALWRYAGYGMGKYWRDASGDIVAPLTGYKYDKDTEEWRQVSPEPEPDWTCVTVRDRLVSGYRAPYNTRLKTTLWKLGGSFLKTGSSYRKEYKEAKEKYEQERDWTKGHVHNAAQRAMVKLFLSHLWDRWRQLEGLPVREPYAHEYLDHSTLKRPEEYGWPALEIRSETVAVLET